MDLQEKVIHVMELVQDHEGTLVYRCPDCGRMVFINLGNKVRVFTIEKGDQTAQHLAVPQNAKL